MSKKSFKEKLAIVKNVTFLNGLVRAKVEIKHIKIPMGKLSAVEKKKILRKYAASILGLIHFIITIPDSLKEIFQILFKHRIWLQNQIILDVVNHGTNLPSAITILIN
ncbi:CLUMA_CG005482, isoform A [Clunio marinus]|uniref:CLUMA_CG005482, isoform A n=1 Tax=Clunio marinus TaxID=568069 RepID=A0A1J1HV19_9DIPT|nr:CLUMA_CG005482, isoform A [Clunio marinus]